MPAESNPQPTTHKLFDVVSLNVKILPSLKEAYAERGTALNYESLATLTDEDTYTVLECDEVRASFTPMLRRPS